MVIFNECNVNFFSKFFDSFVQIWDTCLLSLLVGLISSQIQIRIRWWLAILLCFIYNETRVRRISSDQTKQSELREEGTGPPRACIELGGIRKSVAPNDVIIKFTTRVGNAYCIGRGWQKNKVHNALSHSMEGYLPPLLNAVYVFACYKWYSMRISDFTNWNLFNRSLKFFCKMPRY